MGAWIETKIIDEKSEDYGPSHPTWVRGLKLRLYKVKPFQSTSHPTWVRGLKQKSYTLLSYEDAVAPYVGAWIETLLLQGLV